MTLYADLLRYPDLFANLFRRELYARYKGSLLGVGWTLVNPLVLVGVLFTTLGVLKLYGQCRGIKRSAIPCHRACPSR